MQGNPTPSQSKRVLLVTICFPPEGGGGSIRVTKLAKYLPSFGWQAVVLTSSPPRKPPVAAPSMDADVPVYRAPRLTLLDWAHQLKMWLGGNLRATHGGEIVATRSTAPAAAAAPRRRPSEYLLVPDERIFWVPLAVVLGWYAVRKERAQAIYSTAPTATAHLVGYCLHRLTRLPWIAEFRDPWTANPFRQPRPMAAMERLEQLLESEVLHTAGSIVVIAEPFRDDFMAKFPGLSPDKFVVLPNGFDGDDFTSIQPDRFPKFTIVHTGNYYQQRSSRPFLEGLERWLAREPRVRPQVQVLFVGKQDAPSANSIAQLGLDDVVQQLGTVPHERALQYMLGADLLLLVPGPGKGTMTGKIFEYLAAGKPILAIAEPGVVHDFVTSARIGEVAGPADVAAITAALARMHAQITSGRFVYPDTAELRQKFDRRKIAERMAALLDQLTAQPQGHASAITGACQSTGRETLAG